VDRRPVPARLAGAAMAVLSLLPLGHGHHLAAGKHLAWTSGHHGSAIFLATWGRWLPRFLRTVYCADAHPGSEELSTLVSFSASLVVWRPSVCWEFLSARWP